jgi:membrane protease YdiL (CAAX protease family)
MALGAILAWAYHRTESIWVPVMVHGAYNAVVTTALYAALAQGLDLPRGG